jgi:tRNA-specific 2-thiouridylase
MRAMTRPSRPCVVVALSGGVDSAVAALLLREHGWDVHGLFMSNWDEDDDEAYCSAAQDFQDARAVAATLGIPLHRMSFAAQYRARVFEHFLQEQRAGRTGNPDILCNREIKFGVARRYAARLGGAWFATGHYARLVRGPAGVELHKAADTSKDQSYFLHALERAQLENTLMPLGALHKSAVRERARRSGLPVFDKPDSTGICFIGERPFREFMLRFLPRESGPIETPEGIQLGVHDGLGLYTLGQRAGLAIGGQRGFSAAPWFVAQKNTARNALIVVQGHDHPLLASGELTTQRACWLGEVPQRPLQAHVKVRYRQADQAARIEPRADGSVHIRFEAPQRAVTPGQYAVFYEGARCLGGAVIAAAGMPLPAQTAA